MDIVETGKRAHAVLMKWKDRIPHSPNDFQMFEVLGDMMDVFDLKLVVELKEQPKESADE